MAKRKHRGAAVAAAIGDSMSNVSNMLMRQMTLDRQDQRQASSQMAIANRQDESAKTQLQNQILTGLVKGDYTPDQASALLVSMGRELPEGAEQMRPSPRRRLEDTIGKSLADAESPEDVPGDYDIASIAKTLDIGPAFPGMPEFATEGTPPMSGGPLTELDPLATEFAHRATSRRDALARKPTDIIHGKDLVTGADTVQAVSKNDLAEPMIVGPSAAQSGKLEGEKEINKIFTSGDVEAGQAGKVASATTTGSESAKLAPNLVAGRVDEAARTAAARAAAEMPYQIRLAGERAKMEANASADADHIKSTAQAAAATANLEPFIKRFGELIDKVNTREGASARIAGGARQSMSWLGMDTDVAELDQIIAQNTRKIAQAMGVREANVSDKDAEMVAAGLGVNAMSTRSEAINAYRNLIDTVSIAPIVAARTRADTPMAERIKMTQDLIASRRAAEQEARDAAAAAGKTGAIFMLDPVTQRPLRLIQ